MSSIVYMVYRRDANSFNSHNEFPIAAFLDEYDAEKFARIQPGYGFNKDWFVKPVILYTDNPDEEYREAVLHQAMDKDDLTFGEAVAMLSLMRGERPTNNNPGVFKSMEPLND